MGVDANSGIKARVRIAKVVVAWETAHGRATKDIEVDAEASARSQPKAVPTTVFRAMADTFQKEYGELSDNEVPAKSYVERKLDQIEKQEYKPELLT